MQVFMDKLEAHYGQRPIIYTAPDFYRDNLKGAFPDYPFWLRAVAAHPSKVYPGRKWVFWQYSGSGLSHGVKGRIDLNVFHGDEETWRAWEVAGSRVRASRRSEVQAARRWCRPSVISPTSFGGNASRSPGMSAGDEALVGDDLVSSHLPPALMTSVLIDL